MLNKGVAKATILNNFRRKYHNLAFSIQHFLVCRAIARETRIWRSLALRIRHNLDGIGRFVLQYRESFRRNAVFIILVL